MSARSAVQATIIGIAAVLLLAPVTAFAADPSSSSCRKPTSLVAIQSVPEARRARCFGARPITFEAWGWPIVNTWPFVELPEAFGYDFAFATTLQSEGLLVFLQDVAFPDPVGAPWENRDLAPGDAWWRVTGHFDDPLAAECVPAQDATIDNVPGVKSVNEVRAFCRNHFVVEKMVWLKGGAPDTAIEAVGSSGFPGSRGSPVWFLLALGASVFVVMLRWSPARGSKGGSR